MKTNESTNACPKCGAPVPAEAPQGLCPKCVFVQAVAPEAAPTATANIPSLERLAVAFPQLQIIELIGRGGMGFVFKARQPHLDRFVALKLLPDSLAHDPQFAERFNREGRTLARLNHPNIVSIFDFGQAGGFYYLMMEYVDGVNLRQAMQAGRFSPSEALSIVPKICEALQFAHEEGILHRDIKPENILLDAKGRVKIADFGIAKIVGEENPEVSLTATGAALGTPHYMAPEQFEKPATVDHRADIYSLGVVFYEMLTGELPIGRFSPPSQRTPVDPRVDDVVMRTLEKEREKRFQSAGEMRTNVEHLTESGAGNFKGKPPQSEGAQPGRGSRGTMVINPSAVIPAVSKWSLKAVWAAVLTGLSLPLPVLLIILAFFGVGRLGRWEILTALAIFLPGLAGTILGWMAVSDLRANAGRLRGLPLAVFGALAWPLLLLVGGTLSILSIIVYRATSGISMPFGALLMLAVPAGAITFAIWAVYTAVRWGANKPASPRRGVLKWVFLALLMFGVGIVITTKFRGVHTETAVLAPAFTADTNSTPWIRFTFTAVELREVQGVRWLAIDFLDDVHGECEKSFPWETTIPGFKAETRTTEFFKESEDSSAQLARLRQDLFNTEAQLAEYRSILGNTGSTANNDKDAATAGTSPEKVAEYKIVCARLDAARANEFDLLVQYTEENPLVRRVRERIAEHETRKRSLETENPKLAALYIPQTFGGRANTGSRPDPARIRAFESQIRILTNQIALVRNDLGSSPAVRHQRIEYRMPDSAPRDQLERLRENLEKALKHKSFRLELGENEVPLLLFELPGAEGGSLKAWIKVLPPMKAVASPPRQTAWEQAQASVERVRRQNDEAAKKRAQAKSAPLNETDAALFVLQFRLVADDADTAAPVDVMMESRREGTSVPRRVLRTVLLDGSAVARAGIEWEINSHRTIGVELTTEGARQFGAITAANINRQLAIVSGGRVLSAPIIRTAITEGELLISGGMSAAEVHELVAELNRKPAGLEFSPTVERSLPRAPEFPPGGICLDLESGMFMTNRSFRADQRGTRDWLQTSGVDLVAIGTADQIPVISAYDLAFVEAPTNAWDSLPPQEVGWNWTLMRDAAKQESHLATMLGRPDTFLFRTRENGFGILQIISPTNPAPNVKIRYKLVRLKTATNL